MDNLTTFEGFEYRMNFKIDDPILHHDKYRKQFRKTYIANAIFTSIELFMKKYYTFNREEFNPNSRLYPYQCHINVAVNENIGQYSPFFDDPKEIGGHFEKGMWVKEYSKPELDLVKVKQEVYNQTLPDEIMLNSDLFYDFIEYIHRNHMVYRDNYESLDYYGKKIKVTLNNGIWPNSFSLVSNEKLEDAYTKLKW
jgi:hypothetical protein